MATAWRIGRWVLVVLLVLALVAAAVGTWTVRRSFPATGGEVEVAALDGEVTITRDEWGVAHVYGDTIADVMRGQGYVQAQDRFWEMDVRRHITAGRLAELFGPDQVGTDTFIRTLGWRRVAEQELDLLDERSVDLLESYAEGVNAFIVDRSPAELSLEYAILGLTGDVPPIEPWGPVDSLAWLKAMAWDLRSNADTEVQRALMSTAVPHERVEELNPAYPFDTFDPILTSEAIDGGGLFNGLAGLFGTGSGGLGSNSWVVAGEHTASGAAMLANDPHLAPSQPSLWHQVGLHCRERTPECPLDVSGYGFAGLPGVIIGRTPEIAWGFTNLASDVADHYVERVDGDRYEVDGEWVDMEVRTETVMVTGGDDVDITIRSTRHGPVVSDADDTYLEILDDADLPGLGTLGADGHAVSLRWTALDPGRTFDALYPLNTATDFDGVREAARLWEVPAQNIVYADAEGHIGYQAPGRHPIRAEGHTGRWPAAGWTTATDWQGFLDFEDLPSVLDPPAGVIATANEPVVAPDVVDGLEGEYAPGFRAARIRELLDEALADGEVTFEELGAIQLDNHVGLADILVDPLLAVSVDGHAAVAQALLDGWDGQMDADSPAAAMFGATMRHVVLGTFGDELPGRAQPSDRGGWWLVLDGLLDEPDAAWWDDVTTDEVEDRDDVLRASLVAADQELVERFGSDTDTWRWGAMHTLSPEHGTLGQSGIAPVEAIFNAGPVETSGSGSVVNATGWDPSDGYEVTWLPSMRMLVDLADPDGARWINHTGQSGHAYHPHYDDMLPLWADGETIPWPLTEPAVRDAAVATLTLRP